MEDGVVGATTARVMAVTRRDYFGGHSDVLSGHRYISSVSLVIFYTTKNGCALNEYPRLEVHFAGKKNHEPCLLALRKYLDAVVAV